MTTSFSLRQASAADATVCASIEQAVFPASEAATREQIEIRLAQYPQGFFVAETRQGVVGFTNTGVSVKEDISDEAFKSMIGHDPHGAYIVIFSLAVLPAWQGLGIAGELIRTIISDARRRQKRAILLLCKAHLIQFYERLGFENAGVSASTHGGVSWHQMRLQLADATTSHSVAAEGV